MCLVISLLAVLPVQPVFCWGFFAHRKINRIACFLLPPNMLILYKQHIDDLTEHAVDPDKRRYALKQEGPRHYIDMDRLHPWDSIPRNFHDAQTKFGPDTLLRHGIAPWWIQTMLYRLTQAFEMKNKTAVIQLSAELGHYISDIHVPLHASSNHDGQYSGQQGIHGFWESRIPELLLESQFDLVIGKAQYVRNVPELIWNTVKQSAMAADTVLRLEKLLMQQFRTDQRFSFENRNGMVVRQYSAAYTLAYNDKLNGMVERRLRQAIQTTANLWYTAWINAGQPDLTQLRAQDASPTDSAEWELLNESWRKAGSPGNNCTN